MTHRSVLVSILAVIGAILAVPAAKADIGGIGSPVKPSNAPREEPAAPAETQASKAVQPAAPKPLLVIRFNQKHVYFDRALRQAVNATERAKAGAYYDIVSTVPSGKDRQQNTYFNEVAAENLNTVVQSLVSLGVDSSRIRIRTQPAPQGSSQEVRLFVE